MGKERHEEVDERDKAKDKELQHSESGASNYRELLKTKFNFKTRERSTEKLQDVKGVDIEEARKARINSGRMNSANSGRARDAQSTDAASRREAH